MRLLFLFAVLATLSGCKDEQRLYSYKEAPSSSPAPAAEATAPALPAGHPPLAGGAAPSAAASFAAEPPSPDRPKLPADALVREVEVKGVSFTVPEAWKDTPVASPMRAHQIALPADESGRADGEVVFFHFGPPPGGGTADENIKRWIGQVEPSAPPVVHRQERDGLAVSEVIVEGTLKPSGMGTGPTEPRPDSALYGLIVEGGPEGSLFIKATGSRAAIEAAKPAMATMAETVRIAADGVAP